MSFLLALLSIQPSVAAPEPPRERFADTVEVAEVVVHAVVTDRTGRPVLGLGPADFWIHEEGRQVEVRSAVYHPQGSFAAAQMAVEDAVEELPAVGGGRFFIFLFHDLLRTDRETMGVITHQLRAGRDAGRWVREGLAPGDLAAVASYDYRLKIHQDFTDALAGTLGVLAEKTGGEYFGHIGRFQGPLRQIERRLQGYYLLTYVSKRPGTGYRRIQVTIRERHLEVTARRGYMAQ